MGCKRYLRGGGSHVGDGVGEDGKVFIVVSSCVPIGVCALLEWNKRFERDYSRRMHVVHDLSDFLKLLAGRGKQHHLHHYNLIYQRNEFNLRVWNIVVFSPGVNKKKHCVRVKWRCAIEQSDSFVVFGKESTVCKVIGVVLLLISESG